MNMHTIKHLRKKISSISSWLVRAIEIWHSLNQSKPNNVCSVNTLIIKMRENYQQLKLIKSWETKDSQCDKKQRDGSHPDIVTLISR